MRAPVPVQKDGPRVNEEIRVREVQLIDQTGHNHGPTDIQIALAKAHEAFQPDGSLVDPKRQAGVEGLGKTLASFLAKLKT